MIVFLNGELVPAENALVSVFDRGMLYGDGVFEAIRIFNSKPFRWGLHQQRLERGAEYLGIQLPYAARLEEIARELVRQNGTSNALLRVVLTRGAGPRGYSPKGADKPTLVMSMHEAPPRAVRAPEWSLAISSVRLLANQRLASFKTCNKLAQIMARAEGDASGANEALLLNTDGYVVEGSSSNLFWLTDGSVCTPPLAAGILPGVTRTVIQELCDSIAMPWQESQVTPDQLRKCEGIFLSLTSAGVAEAISLDGQAVARSAIVGRLHDAYWDLLVSECA